MVGGTARRDADTVATDATAASSIPAHRTTRAQPGQSEPSPPQPRVSPSSLESLMVRAQAGDGDAFRDVLHAALPLLREMATSRLGNTPAAETAVQDALRTIHLLRHTYDSARPIRPWLVAIADRRMRDPRTAQERLRSSWRAATDDATLPLGRLLGRLRGRRNALP